MPRTSVASIALAVAVSCGPRAAPAPVPAPTPSPPPAARTGRTADSTRADTARAMPRVLPPAAPTRPRASARTDTIPTRALRGSVRVCAGGDVTLGTNLDTAWTRVASARLRTQFRQRDDPASLLAPLRPVVADAELVLLN